MKRALAFTLMVLAIMIIAVSCEEPQAPHEHTYAPEWSHDDTFHWHASACGHEDEVSDKAPHTWKEGGDENGWIVVEASTETTEGKKHRECTICGYTEDGRIPLKGHVHTFSAYGNNADKHWRTCTTCNEKFSYSHSFSYVSAGAAGHKQTCYCGYSKDTEAHSYNDGKQAISGTTVWNICDNCEYEYKTTNGATNTEVATAGGEADITGTKTVNGTKVVAGNVDIYVEVNATGTTADENTKTKVTFPEGTLKVSNEAEKISLIVNAAPVAVASGADYQTKIDSNEGAAVAAFEFKLEGAIASDLSVKDASDSIKSGATVTTYIAKNLCETFTSAENNGGKLTIKYLGSETEKEDEKAVIESYNKDAGELKFTVYHFSKYAIISQVAEATDNTGKVYLLGGDAKNGSALVAALTAANTAEDKSITSVTLLKNIELGTEISVPELAKEVSLNLNGRTLTVNSENKIIIGKDGVLSVSGATDEQKTFVKGVKVGGSKMNGTYYNTLETAIKKAASGETITLLNDISSLDSTIDVEKSLDLDLGGHTAKADKKVFRIKNGTLTIKNGTIVSRINNPNDSVVAVRDYKILNKESGENSVELGLVLEKDAVIIGETSYGVTAFGVQDAMKLDIYGKIYSANAPVSTNGTNTYKSAVTIKIYTGAELTAYGAPLAYGTDGNLTVGTDTDNKIHDACGIYQPSVYSKLYVYGGTITSKTYSAVEVRNGECEITGGTFKSEAGTYNKDVKTDGKDGPTTQGAAVALNYYGDGVDTEKKGATVTISGGTFEGERQLAVVIKKGITYGTAKVKAIVGNNVEMTYEKIVGTKTGGSGGVAGTYYIDDAAAEADSAIPAWDGASVDTTWYSASKSEFVLTTASQLAGVAKLVNEGKTFENKTIYLGAKINLDNKKWTPIGLYKDENGDGSSKKVFSGTFDGQEHEITGLEIENDNGKSSYRALFGYVDGKVCNLTVKGEVTACDSSGVVAALGDGGILDNVINHVKVSVKTGVKESGENHTQAKVAGLVVAVKNGTEGCVIKNCKNYGEITSSSDVATDAVGGILAWSGIAKLTIENCENHGTVTGGKNQYAGGIVGAIWKAGSTETHTIKLTNCTNDKTIKTKNAETGVLVGSTKVEEKGLTLTECSTTVRGSELVGDGSYTTGTTT